MVKPIANLPYRQAHLVQLQAPGVLLRPADPQADCSAAPLHPVLLDDHGVRRLRQNFDARQFANEPPDL